jgi:acyl carrier protein
LLFRATIMDLITSKVLSLIGRHAHIADRALPFPNDTFGSLGFDSLDSIELMMQLEEEFGIHMDELESSASPETTVQQVIDEVIKLTRQQ